MIQTVVLCGGAGTRLWPLSREKYPKQLLTLVGEDSLLQATLRRTEGNGLMVAEQPIVICNEEYRFVIAEQLRQTGKQGKILLEPVGRNTAPALTMAALEATRDGSDPVLLVMPADHVITDLNAFQAVVVEGEKHAERGNIVTFGIVPDYPETGYGYIKMSEQLLSDARAASIVEFVEKPDLVTAKAYLATGSYLWNSGLFMVRASIWLKAIAISRPDILDASKRAWQGHNVDGDFIRIDKSFASCPSDSIDYAVMEHVASARPGLPEGVVIPLQAGWSDVGAWDSFWKVLPQDDANNAQRGDVILDGCENTLALSSSRLLACVGLNNLAVIETPDAVLVIDKNKTQDVKRIVEQLNLQARAEAKAHRKVHRPWGWYDSVDMGERFQVKRIVVNPGATLSLQMHHHRAEHWVVVTGTAEVTRGDEVFFVSENQSTYIPIGVAHRLANPGKLPLEMIEVQSGAYLGEDDIVRFDDQYGRL